MTRRPVMASRELDLLARRTRHTLADDVVGRPRSGHVTMFLVLQNRQCLVDWALATVLGDGLAVILRVRHILLAAT